VGESVVAAGRLGPVRTRAIVADAVTRTCVAIASYHDLLSAQLGRGERLDHVVGDLVGHLDEREAIGDLDGADERRLEAGLAADGADEVPLSSCFTRSTVRNATRGTRWHAGFGSFAWCVSVGQPTAYPLSRPVGFACGRESEDHSRPPAVR